MSCYIFLNDNAEPTDLIRKLKQKEFKTPIKRKIKTMHHHHIEYRGTKTMEKIGKLTPYPHKRKMSNYTQFPNRESHQRTVRSYLEKMHFKKPTELTKDFALCHIETKEQRLSIF